MSSHYYKLCVGTAVYPGLTASYSGRIPIHRVVIVNATPSFCWVKKSTSLIFKVYSGVGGTQNDGVSPEISKRLV